MTGKGWADEILGLIKNNKESSNKYAKVQGHEFFWDFYKDGEEEQKIICYSGTLGFAIGRQSKNDCWLYAIAVLDLYFNGQEARFAKLGECVNPGTVYEKLKKERNDLVKRGEQLDLINFDAGCSLVDLLQNTCGLTPDSEASFDKDVDKLKSVDGSAKKGVVILASNHYVTAVKVDGGWILVNSAPGAPRLETAKKLMTFKTDDELVKYINGKKDSAIMIFEKNTNS